MQALDIHGTSRKRFSTFFLSYQMKSFGVIAPPFLVLGGDEEESGKQMDSFHREIHS